MGTFGRILRSGGSSAHEESRAQSDRAEGLVREFENSERGWFWETARDGLLAYISDSVASALGREPSDLIDRPFTDLVSTETEDGSATSERGDQMSPPPRSGLSSVGGGSEPPVQFP